MLSNILWVQIIIVWEKNKILRRINIFFGRDIICLGKLSNFLGWIWIYFWLKYELFLVDFNKNLGQGRIFFGQSKTLFLDGMFLDET